MKKEFKQIDDIVEKIFDEIQCVPTHNATDDMSPSLDYILVQAQKIQDILYTTKREVSDAESKND